MITTTSTNGVHHPVDEQIDNLYSWVATPSAPPAPLPEAAFSLCLKGRLAGQDAQLTIRGATYAEFAANVAHVRGLLDPVPTPASPQGEADTTPQCPTHGAMKPSTKGKGWYCPAENADGSWCNRRK